MLFCAYRNEEKDFYPIYYWQKQRNGLRVDLSKECNSVWPKSFDSLHIDTPWTANPQTMVSLFEAKKVTSVSHVTIPLQTTISTSILASIADNQVSPQAFQTSSTKQLSETLSSSSNKIKNTEVQHTLQPNLWAKFFGATRRIWSFNRIPASTVVR